jgi:hypothetical protein
MPVQIQELLFITPQFTKENRGIQVDAALKGILTTEFSIKPPWPGPSICSDNFRLA